MILPRLGMFAKRDLASFSVLSAANFHREQLQRRGDFVTINKGASATLRYKLIALDVDGTLVGPDNRIPPANIKAVADLQRAGLRICLATGRSFAETMPIWQELSLPPCEGMIVLGGAMVSEPATARTLYHKPIPLPLAVEFGDALADAGHAAMAFVDVWRCGFDYFLATDGDADLARKQWFSKMDVKVKQVRRLGESAEMPAPLRISVVTNGVCDNKPGQLAANLQKAFAGRLTVHAILAPNYGVTIVEGFVAGADKYSAIRYVAQAENIKNDQIIAVGDDINDLAMVRQAGLGVAVGRRCKQLADTADFVSDDGLASFVSRLLDGEFD